MEPVTSIDLLLLFDVQRPEISDDGRQAFINLAGEDGEIDAYELQDILNRVFTKGCQDFSS